MDGFLINLGVEAVAEAFACRRSTTDVGKDVFHRATSKVNRRCWSSCVVLLTAPF